MTKLVDHLNGCMCLVCVLFHLTFVVVTQVVEDMVETEAMAVTEASVAIGAMVVEIEAMGEERGAMVEATDPTVAADTPTGVVDTLVAAAVDTGITGKGFKHGIILHKEQFYDCCNHEHFKYGKYYFWF